jgi:hypothetical protein
MPDIRELLILNPRAIALRKNSLPQLLLERLRMALRRIVLLTGRLPGFRGLYMTAYRFHVWVALRVLTRFDGTRAIYLSAGAGRGEIRPGISDIDLVILGDWPEKKQFQLMKCLGLVVMIMPLFDKDSLGGIQTWEDLLRFNNTDLLLAYSYASAKRQWRLLWGENMMQNLPDLELHRRAGAAYTDVRRWWGLYVRMAFSGHVTARDAVFRNSISFKAVADVLRAQMFANGAVPSSRRTDILRQQMPAGDADLLRRLLDSEANDFLEMQGDPRELVTPWLLRRIEAWHTEILGTPSFEVIAATRVVGDANDRLISPEARAHFERMTADAEEKFAGLETVYLVPCAGFLSPDSLALCFAFHANGVPTAAELREWLAPHFDAVLQLKQRISIYLLLEHGAYLLDCVFGLELWSNVLMPFANPDVFDLFSKPDFVLRGTARAKVSATGWSRVSEEILAEELDVRRGAQARFGVLSRPSSLENLRNIWRWLQLLVMERRTIPGEITLPVTVAATRREFASFAPELSSDLQVLEQAMSDAVEGKSVTAEEHIQRVYEWTLAQGFSAKGGS